VLHVCMHPSMYLTSRLLAGWPIYFKDCLVSVVYVLLMSMHPSMYLASCFLTGWPAYFKCCKVSVVRVLCISTHPPTMYVQHNGVYSQ
jgi:hypothetical protein